MNRSIRLIPLISTVLLAACATQAPQPQFIVPEGSESASNLYGYSQAVRVGPWITVSGQVGYDTSSGDFGKNFDQQVRLAFANLATVLKSAGACMDDVTSITTYQLDMGRFNDVVYARNEAFGSHRPTWTALGVTALALPSIQFEVSATAYAPQKSNPEQLR